MKKKWLILRMCLIFVISIIIGFGLYSWNASTLAGNAMPMPFGVGAAVVLSGSMEPELSVDDLVFVHAAESYEVGDIVVFQDGRSLVVHKIIAKDGNLITTKGTANNTADDPIDVKYIKGKVVGSLPYVGAVVTVLKTPVATILLLAAAVLLLVKSYQNERRDEEKALDDIRKQIEELKNSK